MYIEHLQEEGSENRGEEQGSIDTSEDTAVSWEAKRVLVGAGARALFYPTLLYNVVRNKIQSEFHWWDRVDEFVLLGAVPFPTDIPHLKAAGVGGVVTLNEPYETLVPTSLYHDNNIEHLVIPTRDYLFAPSYGDIDQAVEFIHDNAHCRKTTYVHCKAGRGRSTTVVLCYLVKHKLMTPDAAYNYVRTIRPRVLLASSQWQAVQNYYHGLKKPKKDIGMDCLLNRTLGSSKKVDLEDFNADDDSLVLVTESDLDGYEENHADIGCSFKNHIGYNGCYWNLTTSILCYEEMQAVQNYYHGLKKPKKDIGMDCSLNRTLGSSKRVDLEDADDDSLVLVNESDLDGYEENHADIPGKNMLAEAAIARLSCLWLRCQSGQKVPKKKLGSPARNSELRSVGDSHACGSVVSQGRKCQKRSLEEALLGKVS